MALHRSSEWWFWIVTVSNAIVCLLLLGIIWLLLLAMGAFAAGVNEIPAIILLGLGIILTISSWPLAKSVSSQRRRFAGHVFNGVACLDRKSTRLNSSHSSPSRMPSSA